MDLLRQWVQLRNLHGGLNPLIYVRVGVSWQLWSAGVWDAATFTDMLPV